MTRRQNPLAILRSPSPAAPVHAEPGATAPPPPGAAPGSAVFPADFCAQRAEHFLKAARAH